MFEKIVLRRSPDHPQLTLGTLAEALLFYQNVHVFLDYSSFMALSQRIGVKGLIALLSRPNVTSVFCEQTLATHTERIAGTDFHNFVAIVLGGDKDSGALETPKRRFEFYLKRLGHSNKESEKLADKFRRIVPFRRLSDDFFVKGGIVNAASEDLTKKSLMRKAFQAVISNTPGMSHLGIESKIAIEKFGLGFTTITNIDFEEINQIRSLNHGLEPISPAHLANQVLAATADTILAARYGGDFQTNATSSAVIRIKHADLMHHFEREKSEINEFHELALPNMPTVSEVIDNGERSFEEFLKLLEKSSRFQNFLKEANPDEKLILEYIKAVSSEGWINGLPVKALRYVMGASASSIDPTIGTAASLTDSFLFEKLFGGWKPNHFIHGKLKPFVNK
jgi:hypothetical protein